MKPEKYIPYTVNEEFRTYVFGARKSVTLHDAEKVTVEDCVQRVQTKDGLIHIIPNDWICITIKKREK